MAKERLPRIVAPLGGGTGITSDHRLVTGVTGRGRAVSLNDGQVAMPARRSAPVMLANPSPAAAPFWTTRLMFVPFHITYIYFLLPGAYLHYDTLCRQAIRVEFDAMGFREDTAAEELILLQVYDLPHDEAAWVGGSSAWMSGSLIELKQRDGDLRWRIGGRGGDEHFPTEYVAVGWQADAWYRFVMEWQHGVLTVWRNKERLLSIASDTFAPQDTLRVRLGGSPFDAGVAGVTLRNVIISGVSADGAAAPNK